MMKTMKRQAGFTVIEVSLVIAVTGVLLVGATKALRGTNTETAFHTSLRDIQSKIQNTAKEAANSLFPNDAKYDCTLVADSAGVKRPTLTTSPQSFIGGDQDCVFLGKAIQVIKTQAVLNIYSVLGVRTYTSGGKTLPANTFALAAPTPAMAASADLTESYTPPTGSIRLLSAHYDASPNTETDMAGYYNDPAGISGSTGRLLTKTYQFTSNASNPRQDVANCIQETGCTALSLQHWLLCYEDASKQRTAVIDIYSGNSGISSKLTDKVCT